MSVLGKRAFVTPAIIAMNVAMFIVMMAAGADLVNPNPAIHIRFGSNFGPLTWTGEEWRLLTSAFLHFGIIHLALNMYALYQGGALVERLFGSTRFALLYLLSALSGSVVSGWWDPLRNSAGASGAIFGVYGALLAFMAVRRADIPPSMLKSIGSSALLFCLYSLVIGCGASAHRQRLPHRRVVSRLHLGRDPRAPVHARGARRAAAGPIAGGGPRHRVAARVARAAAARERRRACRQHAVPARHRDFRADRSGPRAAPDRHPDVPAECAREPAGNRQALCAPKCSSPGVRHRSRCCRDPACRKTVRSPRACKLACATTCTFANEPSRCGHWRSRPGTRPMRTRARSAEKELGKTLNASTSSCANKWGHSPFPSKRGRS